MDENEPSRRQALMDWLEVKSNEAQCLAALRPFAYKFAALHGLTVEDAATEMYVEVVTRALERTDKFTSGGSPFLWLMKFAYFTAKRWQDDGFREQERLVHASDYDQGDNSQEQFERLLAANIPISQDPSIWVADAIVTKQTLAAMPTQHREVLVQFEQADFDTHVAAQRLNINPVAFRKRMERARAWFKANVAASPAELVAGGHQK